MLLLFKFLLILFVLLLIGHIIYEYYWTRRAIYKFGSKLSGPSTVFLLGTFLTCPKQDVLTVFCELMVPFSSPVRMWFGPRLVVCLRSAEHLQTVMQSSKITTKSYIYKFFEPFIGKGLLTASGKATSNAKKEYHAFFTQRMLEAYSHLFGKHAVKCVEEIKCSENAGVKFDIHSYFSSSSLDSFMDICLEMDEFDTTEYRVVKKFIKRFYQMVYERMLSPWLHPDFVYKQTKTYKEQEKLVKIVKSFIEKFMKTEVFQIVKRMENVEINEKRTKQAPSMLELLIEIRGENLNNFTEITHRFSDFSDDIDNIITLVGASQDTQSSTMAFTCMLLGMFPEAQDKIYAELVEVLDGRNVVDFTDASKLKYLEMCIKEALRLFPSVPFVFRDTTEDFELEDDLVIPENVTVMLSIFEVHRDPKQWEKPNNFYPEHHTLESVAKRHPYAFVPFSRGPRKCIAQQFAYTNMKIMLGTILLNYVIESDEKFEDIKLKTDISIRPINGYFIKIKKRSA